MMGLLGTAAETRASVAEDRESTASSPVLNWLRPGHWLRGGQSVLAGQLSGWGSSGAGLSAFRKSIDPFAGLCNILLNKHIFEINTHIGERGNSLIEHEAQGKKVL